MADYTVNLNNKQEAALDRILADVNAQRTAEGKAPLTKAEYLQRRVTEVGKSWVAQFQDADVSDIVQKLKSEGVTAQQIAAARAAVGL